MNVRINARDISNRTAATTWLQQMEILGSRSNQLEERLVKRHRLRSAVRQQIQIIPVRVFKPHNAQALLVGWLA
ncbi:MAG: hypothetical protein QGG31_04525 [Anaerolineales bacterium]|nr:hypothetical protein [Anaerolineales bacterium]